MKPHSHHPKRANLNLHQFLRPVCQATARTLVPIKEVWDKVEEVRFCYQCRFKLDETEHEIANPVHSFTVFLAHSYLFSQKSCYP